MAPIASGLSEADFTTPQPALVVVNTAGTGDVRHANQVHLVENGWNNLHTRVIEPMFYVGKTLQDLAYDWSWR